MKRLETPFWFEDALSTVAGEYQVVTMGEDKVDLIRNAFSDLIGRTLVGYGTAELLHDDGTWSRWDDLPIRLYAEDGTVIAVSWSGFDDLSLRKDEVLPSWVSGSTIRWTRNSIDELNDALGGVIGQVMLGEGEMSIEGRRIEVWTRLLIEVGGRYMEVFCALDQNGYALHDRMPEGRFVSCV